MGAVTGDNIRDSIPSVSETFSRRKIEEFLDPEACGNVQFNVPSAFLKGLERGYRFGTELSPLLDFVHINSDLRLPRYRNTS